MAETQSLAPQSTRYEPFKADEEMVVERERKSSCSWCKVCCILLCILIFIIVTLGIIALVVYLVLKPKAPKVSVEGAHLQYVNVTTTDGSTSLSDILNLFTNSSAPIVTVQAGLNITVNITNPNKVSLHFEKTYLRTYYQGDNLANSTVPPFKVGHKTSMLVNTDTEFNTPISTSLAENFIKDSFEDSLVLLTNVNMVGHIKLLGITSPKVKASITCNTTIDVPSQKVSSYDCKVLKVSL